MHGPDGKTIPYPEFVPALDATAHRKIGARYVAELRKLAPQAPRITDKMPSNYYFAGLIHLALPNARSSTRCATRSTPASRASPSCSPPSRTTPTIWASSAATIGDIEQLMAHWRRVLPRRPHARRALRGRRRRSGTQARRIIAHCGLAWDERCLAFHETERPVRTASATQVRQPIYNSAIGRWRVYEEFLGPLLAELGLPMV